MIVSKVAKLENYIVSYNKKKQINRRIYNNVPLLDFENQKIAELKKAYAGKHIPEWWKDVDYLKMLQCANYIIKDAVRITNEYILWRTDPLCQSLHKGNLEVLKSGVIYVHGHDRQYRPIVILQANLIDLKKFTQESLIQGISYLLSQVVNFMMVPYHVENWIMILETKKMSVVSLPLKSLSSIISSMQANFCGRLHKMFILNPSTSLDFSWRAISGFIDPDTAEKISFLKSKHFIEIQKLVDPDQLEIKYGGQRQDLTQFWPPTNINYEAPRPQTETQQIPQVETTLRDVQAMKEAKNDLEMVKDIDQHPEEEIQEQKSQIEKNEQKSEMKVSIKAEDELVKVPRQQPSLQQMHSQSSSKFMIIIRNDKNEVSHSESHILPDREVEIQPEEALISEKKVQFQEIHSMKGSPKNASQEMNLDDQEDPLDQLDQKDEADNKFIKDRLFELQSKTKQSTTYNSHWTHHTEIEMDEHIDSKACCARSCLIF